MIKEISLFDNLKETPSLKENNSNRGWKDKTTQSTETKNNINSHDSGNKSENTNSYGLDLRSISIHSDVALINEYVSEIARRSAATANKLDDLADKAERLNIAQNNSNQAKSLYNLSEIVSAQIKINSSISLLTHSRLSAEKVFNLLKD
jgi:hypothetical protein